ncbi:AAA family ATPase [Catenuloplanes niger JCM 9533]|uniref:ABC-type enterochelin transport system ATPase subunit n=1 Tax=Catenuloplanes niger TaxID=587534 RepID=A0AAE3ZJ13_9ACTN|nr:AAA family ATPase [Catenuloplanes niger]MDR7320824.1 ABC-type enterochelin transport system ATPase subunit [Catenuloplanes niger]
MLADLQVHTPADFHQKYGDVGGPTPNQTFADRLVKAHADAGVTVIAVTDHNTLAWYPELAAAGRRHGVVVFPGIEFNVNKCHLMAIWECNEDGYRRGLQFLDVLFPPDGPPALSARREPSPTSTGSPLELVKLAATKYGALVLAPHSTAKGIGLFARSVCNISSQVAQSGFVVGFDVWGDEGAEVLRNPRYEFGDDVPAWFVSGDVRDFETVGKRAVYLKLGTPPTLEGLRQAFLMPEQRIRFPEHLRTKFGRVPGLRFIDDTEPTWPRMTRLTVEGGFHDRLAVELGPGLNAIIGGKGTGKSTAIEIMRHVCAGAAPKTSDNHKNRIANFSANATARLDIVTGDRLIYEIVRSGDDTPPQLLRNGADTGIDVNRRFGISVYGQRELALLPDDQDGLREFLAISADPELKGAQTRESASLRELEKLGAELGALESALAKSVDNEEKLKDVRDQLETASQRGAAQQVEASRELTAVQEEVSATVTWLSEIEPLAGRVETAAEAPDIRAHDSVPPALTAATAQVRSAILAAATMISDAARIAQNAVGPAVAEHNALVQERRHQINAALADAGLRDPDELARLQRTAAQLERAVAKVPDQRQRLEELRTTYIAQLESLRDIRGTISQLLQAAATTVSSTVGGRVRVTVRPLADRDDLLELLVTLVVGKYINRDQLVKLADAGPAQVASAIRGDEDQLVKLGVSKSTAGKLRELSPVGVRDIEKCATPDFIVVEINLGEPEQPRWLDVRKVSPGQKATAMLSLALVTGNNPLIIDQPEDDLDNRYIYDQVVRQLAEVANRRQIIVATHNPNIPILGDAEMIMALDANIDQSTVVACGAIDEPRVADAARQILEGGDKAFQDRARRYRAAR